MKAMFNLTKYHPSGGFGSLKECFLNSYGDKMRGSV